ncbi:putative reverse transcriptase domain-containing protein [Tanacetum coccineum]
MVSHPHKTVLRVTDTFDYLYKPCPEQPADTATEAEKAAFRAEYKKHSDVACIMLGKMSPALQRQFENYPPQNMLAELQKMFEKPPAIEIYDPVDALHSCKQAPGYPKETMGYYFYFPPENKVIVASANPVEPESPRFSVGNIIPVRSLKTKRAPTVWSKLEDSHSYSKAYYDMKIWQMDVKTAFLNGRLDEDIYMEQPEGQKSYADLKRKQMEFEVGDKVMLKVSPWKGVVRFGKRGKLNPRFVGPFKVIKRVGDVAYKLELPEEPSRVHTTFHVSNLKECHADEPLSVSLDGLHFDDKLQFVKEPNRKQNYEVKRFEAKPYPIISATMELQERS